MTPLKRSTAQLDHKDRDTNPSTAGADAGVHHFVLGSFTAVALLAIYILINTPSASIDESNDTEFVPEPVIVNPLDSNSNEITPAVKPQQKEQTETLANISNDLHFDHRIGHTEQIGGNMRPLELPHAEIRFRPSAYLQKQSWIILSVENT